MFLLINNSGDIKMYILKKHLDQFKKMQQNKQIIVLIGVHRSGKTVLLEQLKTHLRRQGINNQQIQLIHCQCFAHHGSQSLCQDIIQGLVQGKRNYLFLDELDTLTDIIPLLHRLLGLDKVTLVVTGANRRFLTRLAPLRDRCTIIPILPLSFVDCCAYQHLTINEHSLYHYLNYGGFPFVQSLHDQLSRDNYFDGIINTLIVNGFAYRSGLCNPYLIKQLAAFLATQVGTSVNISQTVVGLKHAGITTSNKTLHSYLNFLQEVLLFYPCYELAHPTGPVRIKPTNVKYYPVDPGIQSLLAKQKSALSRSNLEALLFLELIRRGYQVYFNHHFSFIADRGPQRVYLQFAYSLSDQAAYDRISASFKHLPSQARRLLIVVKRPNQLIQKNPEVPLISLLDWFQAD